MKGEIDLANSKIITLRAHFGPPPGTESSPGQSLAVPNSGQLNYSEQDRLIDLQQLAISTRSIYGRAQQLRYLIVPALPDPFQGKQGTKEMHAALELACQRRVDHAVALDSALSAEDFRHDIKSEMGFAARSVSGMALMAMGFILDTQALRRKRCGQLCRNNIVHSHDVWLSA